MNTGSKTNKACKKRSITRLRFIILMMALFTMLGNSATAQYKTSWDTTSSSKENPNLKWFKEAKFGLFIHWGLYSKLAGDWKGKRYYGSGEWIMNQAKIPAAEYAKVASEFNPVNFNADAWAQFAQDAGFSYLVITAKHHEGFSMYDTKISDYNIVKASPYGKDPMKALAEATRKRGIKFGFYYSQFLDWHEPNGGGNNWDFDENKKDYLKYYREKSIPQIKELLTNYGPLGIIWFDMAGGLTKEQTKQLVDTFHHIQPNCLFSSRVGQGLGDYTDFGDSELPPAPISGAWESIYTHNDSWGYIKHDMNFKSPAEIIRLLANVASKGGNLMLNVGPDGEGNIPEYSLKFLRETGKWLKQNGESIYSSTYGFVPAQPWGVTTSKPGKLFVHIFNPPKNSVLFIPSLGAPVVKVYMLKDKRNLVWKTNGKDVLVNLPALDNNNPDNVLVVAYKGKQPSYNADEPVTVSRSYDMNTAEAVFAKRKGNTKFESITFSHYFGDWKHAPCITNQLNQGDVAAFPLRITEPGDYKIILEYSCQKESANQEGVVEVNSKTFYFRTLYTSDYNISSPLLFIKHPVAIVSIDKAGIYNLSVRPVRQGNELFKLKSVLLEPL
jgi:alpha-L-fucosidase